MNEDAIKRYASTELKERLARDQSATDWDRLARQSESEIEQAARQDPDFDGQDDAWLSTAKLEMPKPKQLISLRLDAEILDWFKSQGPGYQTRVNAVLLSYVRKHKTPDS